MALLKTDFKRWVQWETREIARCVLLLVDLFSSMYDLKIKLDRSKKIRRVYFKLPRLGWRDF